MAGSEHAVELALEVGAVVGEGPVWDDRHGELLFVDIEGGRVHGYTPASSVHRFFEVGRPVGAVVLRDDGGLVLAADRGFYLAERDGGRIERFGSFHAADERVRFNDGKVDPSGRFIAGTMHWQENDALGCLYQLAGDGNVVTLLEGVTISNGLAWSPGGSVLYYIDTAERRVDAFDVDPGSGGLSGRRPVAHVDDGSPDGMAIDDEGMLWVANWGGSRVDRIDPSSGRVLGFVRVPTRQVSSVAFGGERLDQLFITTAKRGLGEAMLADEPHAGDLFVAEPGVSGPRPHRFRIAGGAAGVGAARSGGGGE